jgi:ABC-type lipoprotein release transport system permease subunit
VFLRLKAMGAFQGEFGQAVEPWPYVLVATTLVVVATRLLATLVPTLKGLRIRPVEALRADA